MNILVTGAKGFVGRNLCENLKNIRDGKNRTRPALNITDIFEYDLDTAPALLDEYCAKADFVFNLAGVNRPKVESEFMAGNFGFASTLLDTLKAHGNTCPVMLSSSIQATLIGRYGKSDYGKSKLAGEELFFEYSKTTGAPVLVYRFPNLFGKWCRPNYNSAVATFCHNIANGLPITVNDRATELELLYIDDLVEEMLDALEAAPHRCNYDGLTPVPAVDGRYCFAPVTHKVTLGEIVDLLEQFHAQPATLVVPEIPAGSFAKKLYSTYLSYLPKERIAFPLKVNADERGSFTELLKTENCGQFSVNISRPGVTKGKQWVSTEKFDLLDMPGVLWKKFDSKTIASNLAFIGSIKDDILDVEELAMNLLDEVRRNYPDLVAQRYKLDAETLALPPYELMEAIGRKRGLLVRGGEVNTERCAIMLVDEFRACKWGRISLERPPQRDDLADFAEEEEE